MAMFIVENGKRREVELGELMQIVRIMAFEPFSPDHRKKLTIVSEEAKVPAGAIKE